MPRIPERLVERAAAWTEKSVPVDAALAASVVLLRETEAGLETYLLHRHARMGFAASMVVFPGGGLDPADRGGRRPGAARCGRPRRRPASAGPDALRPWAHWVTPS